MPPWRFITLHHHLIPRLSLNPSFSTAAEAAALLAPFLNCKRRRKILKKQNSPRHKSIQPEPLRRLPHFESILHRDAAFRFLTRTKSHLSCLPNHSIPLSLAGRLHRELGFPRARKLSRFAVRHPLLLHLTPHHLSFTPLMESLLAEGLNIANTMPPPESPPSASFSCSPPATASPSPSSTTAGSSSASPMTSATASAISPNTSASQSTPPTASTFSNSALAVSVLHRVRRTFNFPIPHRTSLLLDDEEDERPVDSVSTLPLISPYSDGLVLKQWTVEVEKYRVGVVHEFLNLTLEKGDDPPYCGV